MHNSYAAHTPNNVQHTHPTTYHDVVHGAVECAQIVARLAQELPTRAELLEHVERPVQARQARLDRHVEEDREEVVGACIVRGWQQEESMPIKDRNTCRDGAPKRACRLTIATCHVQRRSAEKCMPINDSDTCREGAPPKRACQRTPNRSISRRNTSL